MLKPVRCRIVHRDAPEAPPILDRRDAQAAAVNSHVLIVDDVPPSARRSPDDEFFWVRVATDFMDRTDSHYLRLALRGVHLWFHRRQAYLTERLDLDAEAVAAEIRARGKAGGATIPREQHATLPTLPQPRAGAPDLDRIEHPTRVEELIRLRQERTEWDRLEAEKRASDRAAWDEAEARRRAQERETWDRAEAYRRSAERTRWDEAEAARRAADRAAWDAAEAKRRERDRAEWDRRWLMRVSSEAGPRLTAAVSSREPISEVSSQAAASDAPPQDPPMPLDADTRVTTATGSLSTALVAAEIYLTQKERSGRHALEDATVSRIVDALVHNGGKAPRRTVMVAARVPPASFAGTLAALKRLLNRDGYDIVTYDDREDMLRLDTRLLAEQFELTV